MTSTEEEGGKFNSIMPAGRQRLVLGLRHCGYQAHNMAVIVVVVAVYNDLTFSTFSH